MPKVSVIMGIYNIEKQKKSLELAVNSILNQTFNDLEIIMCDDGSSDRTYQILLEKYEKNKKIKIIKNSQNSGLASALNHCIAHANGEYIARMDADDFSLENRIEKQINFLEKHKDIAFVGCNIILFENKNAWGKRKYPLYPKKENFLFRPPFTHPTIVFRKSCLEKVNNYREDQITWRCEDYDLYMRLYQNGFYGANIQEFLFCFREDQDAFNRRKYKYRLDEARVRYNGFKNLGLLPRGYLYVVKPLIVGLIPQKLLKIIKREGR